MKKALIAMSGGVDSSAAAYLTQKAGYDAFAATIRTGTFACGGSENACTSDAYIDDARALANFFGIEHVTLDYSELFRKHVVDNFISCYISGLTPNPCVECNRHIKFGAMLDYALGRGADTLVTGHYASCVKDGDRYLLKKAKDDTKDQSYVLWQLTQSQLSHVYFPLAEYKKSDVRSLAASIGMMSANRPDSQDICFIPDGDYASFIERESGRAFPGGDFIDTDGKALGKHKGIIHYTIGQRKGLGIALGEHMFVCSKDAENNTVTLCRGDELFSRELTAHHINLIACDSISSSTRVRAKIRYKQKEEAATVTQTAADELHFEFDSPQRAATPGQSVVMYDGDTVIGGGIIKSTPHSYDGAIAPSVFSSDNTKRRRQ